MNTQKKRIGAESKSDLLELKGRQLHEKLIVTIFFFGLAYSLINIIVGLYSHSVVTASLSAGMILSRYWNKRNHVLWAKIWTFIVINLALFVMAFLSIQNVYVYLFYFPIAIGAYTIFLGRDRFYSYLFSIISLVGMTVIVAFEFKGWGMWYLEGSNPALERLLNVFGTFFFLMIEVVFLVRLNEDIQLDLLDSQKALDQANSQLKASVYSRDRIMSMLAHDIRSPLAGIYGFLDLLEQGDMDPAAISKIKVSVKERSAATLEMINDILKWSMTQSSTISFNPVEMGAEEIMTMIHSVSKPYEDFTLANEIIIEKPSTTDFTVDIDRLMMESVLRNLLSNAIKFSKSPRKITFRLQDLEEGIEISVTDNGTGISEDNVKLLHGGTTFTTPGQRNEKGIGLGNQLVLDFLKFHNSSLRIDSKIGQGSKFYFVLPMKHKV